MTDLLLITLLADASQNAMAGDYKSVPDGIILVATIIFGTMPSIGLVISFHGSSGWLNPRPCR
jgi:hypothetical protein